MPLYSGLSRSAQLRGTGKPPSASTLTMMPKVPEWIANQWPVGSFKPAGICSQPLGL